MEKKKVKIRQFNNSRKKDFSLTQYNSLIQNVVDSLKLPPGDLNIVLVNDEYLKILHRDYLNDDSYTDVISFNLGTAKETEAEIYISYDSAQKQASQYQIEIESEIARLIIHGLLHIKGYDDKSADERTRMREMEDHYLEEFWGKERL